MRMFFHWKDQGILRFRDGNRTSLVAVYIFNDEVEVYEPEVQWNKLVLKYLLATQPRAGILLFSTHVTEISKRLNIPMTFRGKLVTHEELERSLNSIADELTAEIGEPGSQDVAIVIESTYPRKRN